MAYVPIPKDLSAVKTKFAFNMTGRQLIMIGIGGALGFLNFTLTRGFIGQTAAMFLLMVTVIPFFFFGIYEKNGKNLEQIIAMQIDYAKSEKVRVYKSKNMYHYLTKEGRETDRAEEQANKKRKRP